MSPKGLNVASIHCLNRSDQIRVEEFQELFPSVVPQRLFLCSGFRAQTILSVGFRLPSSEARLSRQESFCALDYRKPYIIHLGFKNKALKR